MNSPVLAVIGLGYVGLPLAIEFAKKYPVVGFDIRPERISELKAGKDHNREISEQKLRSVFPAVEFRDRTDAPCGLFLDEDPDALEGCNYYIITVPTPIDKHNRPNLEPLFRASEMVANYLNRGDIVIYESTVYPGVTEDECVPLLEKISGLTYNHDFFVGYSPERINPGDKSRTLTNILKITSGSTEEVAEKIDALYRSIITAGTHKASSIKVAEAAKVIENAQRDINIAFVNEVAKIFSLMNIDTNEVLEAAGTKWNFLKFKPGLVGGHCIGVDPFYLAQKAHEIGYYSELILTARRLNDSMGGFVASRVISLMIQKGISVKGARVLNLGFTFKEDCPDIRNTKVIDVIRGLEYYGMDVKTFDPHVCPRETKTAYEIDVHNQIPEGPYETIVLSVAHSEFRDLDLNQYLSENGVIFDVKGFLPEGLADARL
jgi:UDP-N-acetyl-D-galactosamine dehydrogenase